MSLLPTLGLIVVFVTPVPKEAPKDKTTPSIVEDGSASKCRGGESFLIRRNRSRSAGV